MTPAYIGRFAPSPTGPLHAGSLVAALASWLDARALGGRWLVRLEDVDAPRCIAGMGDIILGQLAALGLVSDGPVWVQSARAGAFQKSLDYLAARHLAYPCVCSRKDVETALAVQGAPRARNAELVYPGTCRAGVPPATWQSKPVAWRLRVSAGTSIYQSNSGIAPAFASDLATDNVANNLTRWHDRRLGPQTQAVQTEVGDFVLKRADGCFTYQLAVVVDDAAQGITHIVRGEDLADNTARQIVLQRALGLPTPSYLHTPLAFGANGEKLSKQNGAQALDTAKPLAVLNAAAQVLGLQRADESTPTPTDALAAWVAQWRQLYNCPGD